MPSELPRSPKFLKGALVVFASQKLGPPPTVIVFQYNPEQLSARWPLAPRRRVGWAPSTGVPNTRTGTRVAGKAGRTTAQSLQGETTDGV